MVFETIWNCRKHFENNVSKACILSPDGVWNDLELPNLFENKDGKLCIVKVFEMIWNCRETMKTRTVNGAFWPYLKQFGTFMSRFVDAQPSSPHLHFLLHFLGILFVWLSGKSCRPGPKRPPRSYASDIKIRYKTT